MMFVAYLYQAGMSMFTIRRGQSVAPQIFTVPDALMERIRREAFERRTNMSELVCRILANEFAKLDAVTEKQCDECEPGNSEPANR